MKLDYVILVTVSDAVLAHSPTGSDVTCQATIEVGHRVGVLLGDCEQTLPKTFRHIQCNPIPILLIICTRQDRSVK